MAKRTGTGDQTQRPGDSIEPPPVEPIDEPTSGSLTGALDDPLADDAVSNPNIINR